MTKRFLITREDYYGAKGEIKKTFFAIKENKRFLFWEYLSYVKCRLSDGRKRFVDGPITFKTFVEAENFVNRVLMQETPRMQWNTIIMKEIIKK